MQLFCDPMDCSPPGSSIHGISQARTPEWFAISSAGDLPEAEIKPESPKRGGGFFTTAPPGKSMLLMITCSNPCKLQLLLLSHFSRVQLCGTPKMAAHQAPPSLDSPGKNTGVDCHCLLQCMKVKSESEVTQSCLTLSDPMDCRHMIQQTHS